MSLNISYVPRRIREYEPSLATEAEVPIMRLRIPSLAAMVLATLHTELDPILLLLRPVLHVGGGQRLFCTLGMQLLPDLIHNIVITSIKSSIMSRQSTYFYDIDRIRDHCRHHA